MPLLQHKMLNSSTEDNSGVFGKTVSISKLRDFTELSTFGFDGRRLYKFSAKAVFKYEAVGISNWDTDCVTSGADGFFLSGYANYRGSQLLDIYCVLKAPGIMVYMFAGPRNAFGQVFVRDRDKIIEANKPERGGYLFLTKNITNMTLSPHKVTSVSMEQYTDEIALASLMMVTTDHGFLSGSEFTFLSSGFSRSVSESILATSLMGFQTIPREVTVIQDSKTTATVETWGVVVLCTVLVVSVIMLVAIWVTATKLNGIVPANWRELSQQYDDDAQNRGNCSAPKGILKLGLVENGDGALHFGSVEKETVQWQGQEVKGMALRRWS